MIKTSPAVFAVGNTYQIMVEVNGEALVSVKVGEKIYFDETNGIINSLSPIHRVKVPIEKLNEAGVYRLYIRPVVERRPYGTITDEAIEFNYKFNPLPKENIRAYHISDAHNSVEWPVKAAEAFGDIDLLILNGDIISHSGDPEKFSNLYEICSAITKGSIPVIFSRGNHDMRGRFAERFADYTPNHQGNTYYTFRLGSLWGIVLDCGEDKDDSHAEYGLTVACHPFRERQTEFIKSVIENAHKEYEQAGIETRLIIAHNPFTQQLDPPFNIESEIYSEWASLLKKHVKPDLMICGHTHKHGIHPIGGEKDHLGQPCPVIIASEPLKEGFLGCGFIINKTHIEAVWTDSHGNTLSKEIIEK